MWIGGREYIHFLSQPLEACPEVTITDPLQISKPSPGEVKHVHSVSGSVGRGPGTVTPACQPPSPRAGDHTQCHSLSEL